MTTCGGSYGAGVPFPFDAKAKARNEYKTVPHIIKKIPIIEVTAFGRNKVIISLHTKKGVNRVTR